MYKVLGADGKEYGPVTLEQLRTWVSESRLNTQSKVKPEGAAEWQLVTEIPEVYALLLEALQRGSPANPPPVRAGAGASPSQGLAITSFVLGIFSLVCAGLVTGVPAIIAGHIAHNRSRRNPAQFGGAGFAIAGFAMGYVSLVTTALLAAMLLPALAKAKERASSIMCVNNLKQVGLAYRIWSVDHEDKFPFNVSTNAGGTAEWAVQDENGFDENAPVHLKALAQELANPKILVCPADTKNQAALTFEALAAGNVSYLFRSGTNVTDAAPQEILAECPIHHHVLLADGSVQQPRGQRGIRKR